MIKKTKKPLSLKEYKSIYSKVPRVCVDLVVVVEDKVLLTKRAKYGWVGLWHLPGGVIHLNETAISAVKRVGLEELGKEFLRISFLGYQDFLHGERNGSFGSAVTLVFRCDMENAENIVLDDQSSEAKLFSEVPERLVQEQRNWIESVLKSAGF